ncbi:hypothetical protein [Mucilaginibacter jinjuensis]|uniref:Nickel transport protein n=1 Tax=Mucilaginibacter jinjuensis TaxID=1176721 RepID=A0ABY7T3U9_9SPHI|nr:hypothetical protein [Mucilaginibacter jinjuensis]WCT10401.1 hypothetical protein PQO05_16825 [Mucilaginibacter jinjuensis]
MMNKRVTITIATCIAFLLMFTMFSLNASASAYWLEVSGSGKVNEAVTIQVCYGSIDDYGVRQRDTGKELKLTGDFKFFVTLSDGNREEIQLHPKKDCWEGSFLPRANGIYHIAGINDKHPVVDRSKSGGINEKPVDYLCADYTVGNGTLLDKPTQQLDIITHYEGRKVIIKTYNNGSPAASGTKLRVFNPDNWEKELTLDEHGEATFVPTIKGLYIIRQDWIDKTAGTYLGTAFADTRYRCNYCLKFE